MNGYLVLMSLLQGQLTVPGCAQTPGATRRQRTQQQRAQQQQQRQQQTPGSTQQIKLWEISQRGWNILGRYARVDPTDETLLQDIAVQNLVRAVAQTVGSGNTSWSNVDVGANIGDVTISMATEFKGGPVFAFEPNKAVFANLRRKVANLSSVELVLAVAGNKHGAVVEIRGPREAKGTDSFTGAGVAGRKAHSNVVFNTAPSVRLDEWAQSKMIQGFNFVKVDTEGFDPYVIDGVGDFLSPSRTSVLVFEFNCLQWMHAAPLAGALESRGLEGADRSVKRNGGLRRIVAFLKTRGFKVFMLSPVKLLEIDADDWAAVYSSVSWCVTSNVVVVAPKFATDLANAFERVSNTSIVRTSL